MAVSILDDPDGLAKEFSVSLPRLAFVKSDSFLDAA
jgi:hypothetical protein